MWLLRAFVNWLPWFFFCWYGCTLVLVLFTFQATLKGGKLGGWSGLLNIHSLFVNCNKTSHIGHTCNSIKNTMLELIWWWKLIKIDFEVSFYLYLYFIYNLDYINSHQFIFYFQLGDQFIINLLVNTAYTIYIFYLTHWQLRKRRRAKTYLVLAS